MMHSMRPKLPIFYGEVDDSSFYGKDGADAYPRWEKKVNLLFEEDEIFLSKKAKLRITRDSLRGLARQWWDDQLLKFDYVPTWEEMKRSMRKRCLPVDLHSDKPCDKLDKLMCSMQKKMDSLSSRLEAKIVAEKVEVEHIIQEENPTSTLLFHTRVSITDKVCLLVIDDMNCTNLVSTSLVWLRMLHHL